MFDVSTLPKPAAILLQKQLKSLGFYSGTTRGIPGPKTRAAYDAFVLSQGQEYIQPNMASEFVKIAQSKIGTVEQGGNNRGREVEEFQRATWLDGTGWAWCAAFVCWALMRLGEKHPLPFARPRGAGAFWFEDWANQQEIKVLGPRAKIKKGDIVIFSFSHIGIASQDEKNNQFMCVEGNTNDGGSRDGDGVFEKRRPKSQVRSIIRPFN